MLEVGYERPSGPSHDPEDDILQPSSSAPDLAPADRLGTCDVLLGFGSPLANLVLVILGCGCHTCLCMQDMCNMCIVTT